MTTEPTTEPSEPQGYELLRAALRDVAVPAEDRDRAIRAALDEFDVRPDRATMAPARGGRRWSTTTWATGLLGAAAAAVVAVVGFQALSHRSTGDVALTSHDSTVAKQASAAEQVAAPTSPVGVADSLAPENMPMSVTPASDVGLTADGPVSARSADVDPTSLAGGAVPSAPAGGAGTPGAALSSLDELRSWVAARQVDTSAGTPSSPAAASDARIDSAPTWPPSCTMPDDGVVLGSVTYRAMPATVVLHPSGAVDVVRIEDCMIVAHLA